MLNRLKAAFRWNPFNRAPYSMSAPAGMTPEVAIFAGGCFWGVEHIFLKHYAPEENKGILKTKVGFTGGKTGDTNYREVSSGDTEHAEALRIEFDPTIVSYAELVEFFYRTHDPTTINKQGNDRGAQYRSVIFYASPQQKDIAQRVTDEVQKKHFDPKEGKIVTEILEAGQWVDAEEYHQLYLLKNPTGYHCYTHKLHW